jgi:centromeric protein E
VRVRPLSNKEIQRGEASVWNVDAEGIACTAKNGANVPKYAFEKVYHENDGNADVYRGTGAEIVHAAVQGINGTIFAYGTRAQLARNVPQ